jgi:hypothetical protein
MSFPVQLLIRTVKYGASIECYHVVSEADRVFINYGSVADGVFIEGIMIKGHSYSPFLNWMRGTLI